MRDWEAGGEFFEEGAEAYEAAYAVEEAGEGEEGEYHAQDAYDTPAPAPAPGAEGKKGFFGRLAAKVGSGKGSKGGRKAGGGGGSVQQVDW